jgi:hypothetical protein
LVGVVATGTALVIAYWGFLSMLDPASRGNLGIETKDSKTPRWNRHKLLVSIAGVIIVAVGHWFIYGRAHPVPGDALVGVLETDERTHTATAQLQNRGSYIIDYVLLDVWSSPRMKCAKDRPGCSSTGYKNSDAEQRGSYRCGERLGAGPGTSFSCDFSYPLDTLYGHFFGWSITQGFGRPRDPLGIYN